MQRDEHGKELAGGEATYAAGGEASGEPCATGTLALDSGLQKSVSVVFVTGALTN